MVQSLLVTVMSQHNVMYRLEHSSLREGSASMRGGLICSIEWYLPRYLWAS